MRVPGTAEAGTAEPGTEVTGTVEPDTEEPGTEEPVIGEAGTEEPATEEPGIGEPSTEEPELGAKEQMQMCAHTTHTYMRTNNTNTHNTTHTHRDYSNNLKIQQSHLMRVCSRRTSFRMWRYWKEKQLHSQLQPQ